MAQTKPGSHKESKKEEEDRDTKTDREMEVEKDKEQTDTGRCVENDSQRDKHTKHRERKTERVRSGHEQKDTRNGQGTFHYV